MNDPINSHLHYPNAKEKGQCPLLVHDLEAFLQLIADGDEIAFAQLFAHYRDRVFSIAFKLTKSRVIAEEIVQNVFLKIWLKRADLSEIQNFNAYLFIVARNDVYKFLKEAARNYKMILLPGKDQTNVNNNTADLLMDKEYNLLLKNAVLRLSSQQKQIYYLVKDQGFKRDEVARKLHIQPETVKFHLARAMKNIRAFCLLQLDSIIGLTILFSQLRRNN